MTGESCDRVASFYRGFDYIKYVFGKLNRELQDLSIVSQFAISKQTPVFEHFDCFKSCHRRFFLQIPTLIFDRLSQNSLCNRRPAGSEGLIAAQMDRS